MSKKVAPRKRESSNRWKYARAAKKAVVQLDGVAKMKGHGWQWLHRASGMAIDIDERNRFLVEARVIAHFGADLRALGLEIQEAVAAAIRTLSDRPIGNIDVVVESLNLPTE
jgi:uncharacterized alkaline shock family protein YloU